MNKLTYNEVKEIIENEGYTLLSKEYINAHSKLKMKCCNNHICEINLNNFKNKKRCNQCYLEAKLKEQENRAKELLNKFDYEFLKIKDFNRKSKIIAKCPKGHIYETRLDHFKAGRRCPICSSQTFSYEYVKKYIEDNGYKLITKNYINVYQKLKMICPKGHEYECNFHNFSNNTRCSKCQRSLGEEEIEKYLLKHNIDFKYQYSFLDCKNIFQLPFDFAIFNKNKLVCLIEYDGIQHFKPVERFGGKSSFELTKKNDEIKNNYCIKNNIKLLRIPYWNYKNIENIIIKIKSGESSTTK